MDEVALKRAVQKADQVKRLIDTHKVIWEELEADIWKMWQASGSDDRERREDLYREQHAIKAIRARLNRLVNEGKKAEEELTQRKHGNTSRT